MAVAAFYEIRGMTREQYDRIMREAFDDKLAPGVLSHAAGPMDGGWWAADVYESQEVADRLGQQIVPGLQAMGIAAPRVTVRPVHNVLTRS